MRSRYDEQSALVFCRSLSHPGPHLVINLARHEIESVGPSSWNFMLPLRSNQEFPGSLLYIYIYYIAVLALALVVIAIIAFARPRVISGAKHLAPETNTRAISDLYKLCISLLEKIRGKTVIARIR